MPFWVKFQNDFNFRDWILLIMHTQWPDTFDHIILIIFYKDYIPVIMKINFRQWSMGYNISIKRFGQKLERNWLMKSKETMCKSCIRSSLKEMKYGKKRNFASNKCLIITMVFIYKKKHFNILHWHFVNCCYHY